MSSKTAQNQRFDTILILTYGYLLLQILANLTVGKFISLGPTFSMAVGTLLYPLTFTWIDLINDRFGKTRARRVVNVALIVQVLMALWFQFYVALPGSEWWRNDPFPQDAISYVLGGVLRVIVASYVAQFISGHTDITVFHFVRSNFPDLPRWSRALASNLISQPLDSLIFGLLAFLGTVGFNELLSIIGGTAIYKLIMGVVSIPMIYLVSSRPAHENVGGVQDDTQEGLMA